MNGERLVLYPGECLENLTPRQIDYRRFLATPQWKKLRQECYRLADFQCCKCHQSNRVLNAHHKTYPERFEDTRQEHLECLCHACHLELHGLNGKPKPSEFTSWPEVLLARSKRQISRGEFHFWRRKLNPSRKFLTVKKKKRRRKKTKDQWKGSGLEFKKRRHLQLSPVKYWRNRSTSSN